MRDDKKDVRKTREIAQFCSITATQGRYAHAIVHVELILKQEGWVIPNDIIVQSVRAAFHDRLAMITMRLHDKAKGAQSIEKIVPKLGAAKTRDVYLPDLSKREKLISALERWSILKKEAAFGRLETFRHNVLAHPGQLTGERASGTDLIVCALNTFIVTHDVADCLGVLDLDPEVSDLESIRHAKMFWRRFATAIPEEQANQF